PTATPRPTLSGTPEPITPEPIPPPTATPEPIPPPTATPAPAASAIRVSITADVASACGLKTRDWDVSVADEWKTLRTALIGCQNDLLASLRDGLADVNKRAAAIRAEAPDATLGDGDSASLVTAAVADEVPAALLDALAGGVSDHSTIVDQPVTSDEEARAVRLTEAFATLNERIAQLEKRLSAVGDDAVLASHEAWHVIQQQQSRTLQTLSAVSRALHDAAMKSIQNIRA
ncbi:MAG: hypothetical protein J4N29_04160, partial [Chloroflexi bacterium]|nr:hypothetical protein [Chloroflexota bacterium]